HRHRHDCRPVRRGRVLFEPDEGVRALIFITGVLALLAGLAIVNAHNLWVPDSRLVVTVLGWLFILRGIMNLVSPAVVQTIGDRIVASRGGVITGAAYRARRHPLDYGL